MDEDYQETSRTREEDYNEDDDQDAQSDNFQKLIVPAGGHKKKMNIMDTTISIISCIVGAGIVSIPFAIGTSGFVNGIYINLVVLVIIMFATHLYLIAMDYLQLHSLSELCYISMGRSSIFIVNGFMGFTFFFVLILYNVLFSKLALALFQNSGLVELSGLNDDNLLVYVMQQRQTYIALLLILLYPQYMKKGFVELKLQGYILFAAIISLLGVLLVKNLDNKIVVKQAEPEYKLDNFVDAFNISITSYGFFNKIFPVFQEMEQRTYKHRMISVLLAVSFCFIVYASFAYLAIQQYGNTVQVSILANFSKDKDLMTFGVQFLFFVVFVNNIPYNFFPGKLCIMNLVQEHYKRCFSKNLERRINANLNNHQVHQDSYMNHETIDDLDKEVDIVDITDNRTHDIIVFFYAIFICIIAMLIEDLSLILGVYSSFCECFNDFFLPGALVFCALRYKRQSINEPITKIVAVVWFSIGITYWTIANYFNLKKLHMI